MCEMIYIYIKIHQNELYLRQSFFCFCHISETRQVSDCNTTQLRT